jgi:hypothetical protein
MERPNLEQTVRHTLQDDGTQPELLKQQEKRTTVSQQEGQEKLSLIEQQNDRSTEAPRIMEVSARSPIEILAQHKIGSHALLDYQRLMEQNNKNRPEAARAEPMQASMESSTNVNYPPQFHPSSFQPSPFQPSSFQPSPFQPSSFQPSPFHPMQLQLMEQNNKNRLEAAKAGPTQAPFEPSHNVSHPTYFQTMHLRMLEQQNKNRLEASRVGTTSPLERSSTETPAQSSKDNNQAGATQKRKRRDSAEERLAQLGGVSTDITSGESSINNNATLVQSTDQGVSWFFHSTD